MMWWYGPGMSPWGYGLMTVSMVLFWALVIAGIVVLVRQLARGSAVRRPDAEQMLAERFARGEIDEREYGERLDVLRDGPRHPVEP